MGKVTISDAAKILRISKKTLMRWDAGGKFPAEREPVSNIRVYEREKLEKLARWFDLKKRRQEHLDKLESIQKRVDQFSGYTVGIPPKPEFTDPKEAIKAYEDLKDWHKKNGELIEEYAEFIGEFYGGLEK